MFWCTVHVLGTERLRQILQTTHGSVRDMNPSVCFISAISAQLSVVESEFLFFTYNCLVRGPGSSVGIATGYGLNGPSGGEIFRTCPDRPRGPPSLLYNGYRVFPGGEERPRRDADPSPLLVPWSRNSRAIPLLPPMGRTACTEPQCLYKGALYLTVW